MNTMREEWERYKALSYPNGMHPQQQKEVENAFMAGAIIVLIGVSDLADLPEDDGIQVLDRLHKEKEAFIVEKLRVIKGQ